MKMSDMELLHEGRDLEGKSYLTGAYGPHLLLDCHCCNAKRFSYKVWHKKSTVQCMIARILRQTKKAYLERV